jgi:N-acetylglutamate synthase-like GNAT family acetyltransferase
VTTSCPVLSFLSANAEFCKDVGVIAVHQDYQRRGVGTLLVQWGLAEAERLQLPIYLQASTAGYPLYLKLGFHKVDTVVIKAEDWDGSSDKAYNAMVKYPDERSSLEGQGKPVNGAA